MLISILDPALLFYKLADWQNQEEHCYHRLGALALHSQTVQKYGQKMAMSDDLKDLMFRSFPWDGISQRIGGLHDLLNFMLHDLQTVADTIVTKRVAAIELEPAGVICEHVEKQEIIDAWEELLCSCMDATDSYESLIATWETLAVCKCKSVNLTIHNPDSRPDDQYDIPLVWDDDSWATQLVEQDWWPDLQKCVELEFKTNHGIRNHQEVREQPIPFEFGEEFYPSLDRFCTDDSLRRSLVEALTRKVYGIPVGRQRDKPIEGNKWRLWVTYSWRIHYRPEDDRIVFLKFGPHRIDGIG